MCNSFCRFTVTAMQNTAKDYGKTIEALRECVCRYLFQGFVVVVESIQMNQTKSDFYFNAMGRL